MKPPRTKRQPSTIDRLPDRLKDLLGQLMREGRTITEIHDHLRQLGADVSRSAVGRHVKSMAEVGDELRRAGSMAKYIVDEFGAETDERVGRANIAILQGALLELMTERPVDEETGQPVRLGPDEAKAISLTLQRLISSQRMDADRQLKLRAEAKREAAQEAAAAVDKAGRAQGVSKATIDAIKAEILGVSA